MKALVLKQYMEFEYTDIPEPSIKPKEVLIRVKACGVCGSDVHGIDGSSGRRIPPIVMGHEASGVIERVGSDVQGWQMGDRVTFDSTIYCGTCHFCRKGLINLCDNRRVFGVSCEDYRQNGAFAEFVAVPEHILYRIPDDVSFELAAMVEALSVAFHAIEQTPISLNDTAVVVGTGMIGLLIIQSLRLSGCGKIIAVDLDESRLDMALQMGADVALNSSSVDVAEEVFKLTEDRGADLAFEVVGIAATLQMGIASLRKGGSITLVGNLQPTGEFQIQSVVTRQIAMYGSCASNGEYPACLEMIARGKINLEPLISKVAPLSEGAEWFKRLYNREQGLMKVILKP
ncbi:MAG: galactitol-1-phosphate 5-dehydrogenase [Anaerolineales bacterium]|nr:galactitol-1-phosphate 5-dehydrogenase [Anaerolineales bacterium]